MAFILCSSFWITHTHTQYIHNFWIGEMKRTPKWDRLNSLYRLTHTQILHQLVDLFIFRAFLATWIQQFYVVHVCVCVCVFLSFWMGKLNNNLHVPNKSPMYQHCYITTFSEEIIKRIETLFLRDQKTREKLRASATYISYVLITFSLWTL